MGNWNKIKSIHKFKFRLEKFLKTRIGELESINYSFKKVCSWTEWISLWSWKVIIVAQVGVEFFGRKFGENKFLT